MKANNPLFSGVKNTRGGLREPFSESARAFFCYELKYASSQSYLAVIQSVR